MASRNSQDLQYEWIIATKSNEKKTRSLYCGRDSETTLANLFAMYLRAKGDVSDWKAVGRFGGIVSEFSNLDVSTIAVYLGIDTSDLIKPHQRVTTTGHREKLQWELAGFDDEILLFERRINYV